MQVKIALVEPQTKVGKKLLKGLLGEEGVCIYVTRELGDLSRLELFHTIVGNIKLDSYRSDELVLGQVVKGVLAYLLPLRQGEQTHSMLLYHP